MRTPSSTSCVNPTPACPAGENCRSSSTSVLSVSSLPGFLILDSQGWGLLRFPLCYPVMIPCFHSTAGKRLYLVDLFFKKVQNKRRQQCFSDEPLCHQMTRAALKTLVTPPSSLVRQRRTSVVSAIVDLSSRLARMCMCACVNACVTGAVALCSVPTPTSSSYAD